MHFEFIDRTSTIRITFERRKRWNRISREWQIHFHQTFAFFQRNSRSVLRSFDQLPPPPSLLPVQLYSTSTRRRERRILKRGEEKKIPRRNFIGGIATPSSVFDRFVLTFSRHILTHHSSPKDSQTRTLLDHAFSRHNLSWPLSALQIPKATPYPLLLNACPRISLPSITCMWIMQRLRERFFFFLVLRLFEKLKEERFCY